MQRNPHPLQPLLIGPFKTTAAETADRLTVFTFDLEGVGLDVLAGRGHGDHVERKFPL